MMVMPLPVFYVEALMPPPGAKSPVAVKRPELSRLMEVPS
jgi:hypothetical protein